MLFLTKQKNVIINSNNFKNLIVILFILKFKNVNINLITQKNYLFIYLIN